MVIICHKVLYMQLRIGLTSSRSLFCKSADAAMSKDALIFTPLTCFVDPDPTSSKRLPFMGPSRATRPSNVSETR
jgi:hypothetical protein